MMTEKEFITQVLEQAERLFDWGPGDLIDEICEYLEDTEK